jgi:hypothetical protein
MVAAFLHEDARHAEAAEDPAGGTAREDYLGEVTVDRRTFTQTAHAVTTLDLTWPGVEVRVRSVIDATISADGVDVAIDTRASLDDHLVDSRTWRETIPRP